MKNRQKGYIGIVIVSGTIIAAYCLIVTVRLFTAKSIIFSHVAIDWSIMMLLFILSRSLPVYIAADKTIDVSFVPVVASTMIYGLHPTIALFSLSILFLFVADETTGKYVYLLSRSPVKELFNMSNIIISIFIGALPLNPLGGYGSDFSFPYSILPAAVFGILTITVNLILFLLYFVAEGAERFAAVLVQTIMGILPNVASTIPFGIFIAMLLNRDNGSYFVLLFILPLLLARYSFKLYLDSRSLHIRTITALSRAIEAKDPYTKGHSQRVAYFSEKIASYLHLPGKTVQDLKIAALLHDVGKIGVDDRILNKPDRLTESERTEIKKHPVIGREIIEEIRLPQTVNEAILLHHRYYDGSGYPEGDEYPIELPLVAAILGIADAYDAMTSDRPYRKRMESGKAVEILKQNSGTQFDPRVVEAMIHILSEQNKTDEAILYEA